MSLLYVDHTSSLQRWLAGSLLFHLLLLVWYWQSSLHFSSSSSSAWLAIEVISGASTDKVTGKTASALSSGAAKSSSRVKKGPYVVSQRARPGMNSTQDNSLTEQSVAPSGIQSSTQASSGHGEVFDTWNLESELSLQGASGSSHPRAIYLGRIYTKILRRVQYPEAAKRLGIQGRVKVRLQLRWRTGEVISSQVLESPHPLLSQATEQVIKSLRQIDPAEPGLFPSDEIVLLVPFHYQLRE